MMRSGIPGAEYAHYRNPTVPRPWSMAAAQIFLLAVAAAVLLPMIWMFSSSFKTINDIMRFPPTIWPRQYTFQAYLRLSEAAPITLTVFNSLYIAILVTLGVLLFSSAAGFALARYRFRGRALFLGTVLMLLMVPGVVTLFPMYWIFVRLGWIDTHIPLIVPGLTGAYPVFFMRQYMKKLPDEILESARIDGCSEYRIFWSIALPMIMPALVTLAIFTFMGSWNSFLWPWILIKSKHLYTLPLALYNTEDPLVPNFNVVMATSGISVLPLLLIFAAFHRSFLQGQMAGAIKG